MSGQAVDLILEWALDEKGHFAAERVIRWPMLRTLPDDTHASLQRRLADGQVPLLEVDGEALAGGAVAELTIHGHLRVLTDYPRGLAEERIIFPSVLAPAVIDQRTVTNTSGQAKTLRIPAWRQLDTTLTGRWGKYVVEQFIIGAGRYRLAPGESLSFAEVRTARTLGEAPYYGNPGAELAARVAFIRQCEADLVLETPDPVLDRLFAFAKLRATESIFATRGGLMHGPGGYNKYLAAIWANDQAEYINPFFPFLGHPVGNESALNSFRHFARYMNSDFTPIPSSIIAEGRDYWNGAGDRGDMAMIAYGAARFALASGKPSWSAELWPLIEWCLEYCRRQQLPSGVIASDSDELEGRFPAGEANLCTSSLYYDALLSAAFLAEEMGLPATLAATYRTQAQQLRTAIDDYFAAEVEGFATYQYYEGNDILRSWICIPLTVGIYERAAGTTAALFSPRLWTEDGLLTQAGTETVWDRSTLYGLRGVLAAGRVEEGVQKLQAFSCERLLGDHVPYVIEAYPEQNQSHLSAESGLYCRIFTEGLFGIRPTGWRSFTCRPHLPEDWNEMALRSIRAFGQRWDLTVSRNQEALKVTVRDAAGTLLYEKAAPAGTVHVISLGAGAR
jgi:hypothetical protein